MMFSIELDPSSKGIASLVSAQRRRIADLTDYECEVLEKFCRGVGCFDDADFIRSFVRQRKEPTEVPYVGDREIMDTNYPIESHGTRGGERVIRSTRPMGG